MPPADDLPPGRPRRAPYIVDCAAGKHAWCRCMRSATYPLCDGSHRSLAAPPPSDAQQTGSGPIAPLKITLATPQRVAWCACGKTGTPPFCDGAHNRSDAGDGSV
ncbi:MAG: CDGSH iron-sulfur domain-containing protein [Planctomycetota bacterium]|jgi:CDGSH-type Zn-finger protein